MRGNSRTGADIIVDTLLEAGVRHVFGIVSIHNPSILEHPACQSWMRQHKNRQTVLQIIVDTLIKAGVRHVFGIVSIHNMPVVDAISRTDGIDLITVRHESSAAHMADGYARATGGLGVALGSTGPGTTNLMTGLYESAFASSRMLAITGQAETTFYGKGKGYVHEAENQKLMLQTVARSVASPRYPVEIGTMLVSVIESILSGRPQPGAIEVPIDLQYATTSAEIPSINIANPVAPDVDVLSAAVSLIGNAGKRVIIAGGGITGEDGGYLLWDLTERMFVIP